MAFSLIRYLRIIRISGSQQYAGWYFNHRTTVEELNSKSTTFLSDEA